ncbi:threonine/serine exporter family protein [Reichenbachiella ulvae]|uniref:Threonine/serine exporter family protein n=1 Tax=Reichenbachiella ulvae TaxID=2980104 RepID=A0ABT3CUN7_9BACT|nr:threonine/serine exporter family protein [Reichenbachiella ulvae]MCV9387307.1 threonine/serine exporter family protein [Reichenbachiella ulvae]
MAEKENGQELKELAQTLLQIGALLMSSGANSQRIRKTLHRIAGEFQCHIDLLITHRALMLNISDAQKQHFYSAIKRTEPVGVNFKIVSGISRMSWRLVQEHWSIAQLKKELDGLLSLTHYPRIVILLMVGLAGASFCRLFGGEWLDMVVTFSATFIGLVVRQEVTKRSFNPYLCIFFAAFTSSLIAGFPVVYFDVIHEQALFSAVLYLIPGVPLINSFSDLIHGETMTGIVRSVNGLLIAFSIALGFMLATKICELYLI